MPDEVTLHLTIPPELGDRDEILAELRRRVAAVEQECARQRAQAGQKVLGRNAVLRQSWRESPTSREPRRNRRPLFAARSLWARLEAIRRNRDFVDAHRKARLALLLPDQSVPFPPGTYWRVARVAVAAQQSN